MSELTRRVGRLVQRGLVRFRHGVAPRSPSLLDALSQVFLQELIDDRSRYLAAQPQVDKPLKVLREEVAATYAVALQAQAAALAAGAAAASLPAHDAELLARLDRLCIEVDRLASALRSPRALRQLLQRLRPPSTAASDGWHAGPLAQVAPQLAAHIWLRALHETALAMLLRDYRDRAVPDSARFRLLALFDHLQQVAAAWRPAPALASALAWEARLHVALARNDGQVHLPLRAIDTAPLTYGSGDAGYHGRPDEVPLRLARQMRHADGVVLVTGYRGVGKSSFVNRALHHATAGQIGAADGWIVVPVALSVAKATNVASVLRLTLRSIREALIDPASLRPRSVPGASPQQLPLSADELGQLEWAYQRATWNVVLNRSNLDEGEWSAGVSLGLSPGKFLGGAIAPSATLGLKRLRQQKLRRELSLRDYDEDAAEGDIKQIIDSLAQPRGVAGQARRIKLVLVFDELDKLDFDKSVEPLLDGLKNLFLHRHAVFVLVTSKQMYYKLHDQRSKEDAALSSYFSAVVHVPLLSSAQTRELLHHWLDRELLPEAAGALADAEERTIDRLARYLTYKSLGNPRDIIRELRQMQQWSAHGDRPFLSDRVANLGEVTLIAAVQAAVESAAVPWQGSADSPGAAASPAQPGELTLASERVGSDEARLEQIRRGLYILVEAAIDRQTLVLDAKTLEPLREHNLSLLSPADVLRLARQLGEHLARVRAPAATGDAPGAVPRPLFLLDGRKGQTTLSVTKEFYERSGRLAMLETAPDAPGDAARPSGNPAQDARGFFSHGGDAERWLAIKVVAEMPPDEVPADLVERLREVVHGHTQPSYRAAALSATPRAAALSAGFGLAARAGKEGSTSVLTELLAKAAGALGDAQQQAATTILLSLLHADGDPAEPLAGLSLMLRPDHDIVVVALQGLAKVAACDVTDELRRFLLVNAAQPRDVLDEAMKTLVAIAERHDVDLVDELLADIEVHQARSLHEAIAAQIGAILRRRGAMPGVQALLAAADDAEVSVLLRSVIVEAARTRDEMTARLLLSQLGNGNGNGGDGSAMTAPAAQQRLLSALAGPALSETVKPYLDDAWQAIAERNPDEQPRAERARASVATALQAWSKLGTLRAGVLAGTLAGLRPNPAWGLLNPARSRPNLVLDQLAQQVAAPGSLFDSGATMAGLRSSAIGTTYLPPRREVSYRFDAWGLLLLLASALPFVATLFVPGDVPEGAGFGTLLLARTISLGFPVSALLLPLLLATAQARREMANRVSTFDAGTDWSSQWQQLAMLPCLLALGGLIEAHKAYISPLTFWPTQLSLLALNIAALVIGYWGYSRMADERWTGGHLI